MMINPKKFDSSGFLTICSFSCSYYCNDPAIRQSPYSSPPCPEYAVFDISARLEVSFPHEQWDRFDVRSDDSPHRRKRKFLLFISKPQVKSADFAVS